MPQSREARRARRRRPAAQAGPSPPPIDASPSTGSQPALARWASLLAWSRHPATAGLVLCIIVAASFYPALWAGFVLDDNLFAESPVIQAWSGIWNIWFSPADIEGEGHYWPITYTSFWLEDKLWGITPFGTHLVNVLLYMTNVLLLWCLLRHLSVPGAWAVAAVFAVHPMHVDSVAWAIGRKDLLSGLFYVAATICWVRSVGGFGEVRDQTSCSVRGVRAGSYLAALGLFVAAMLSKSVAVTLPVAFAILLWWKNGRVTWADVWRIAPFFLVAVAISVGDLSYYTSGREFAIDHGVVERLMIAARALSYYALKIVWPTDLSVIGPVWDIDTGDLLAWGHVVAALGLAALLWSVRHRIGRGPLAGALFFVVTLSPVLGFVDFAYMRISFVADRYAYLPGIGVIAVLIGAATHYVSKVPDLSKLGASGVLGVVLAVFGGLTWEHIGVYRDPITFYSHVLSLVPNAPTIHRNLAVVLNDAGRSEDALAASRIAVSRRPDSANAHNTLGRVLFALDRLDEAAESFGRALELNPRHDHARRNIARTRLRQGRLVESLKWYREAIDFDLESASAHAGMGEALFRLGQYEEALRSLEQAFALQPQGLPSSTHHFLAEALRKQDRHEEAIERYHAVLEIDPGFSYAHAGIGYALCSLQRYEEGLEWLAQSISLDPESAAAADRYWMMGQASEALGLTKAADDHYQRALATDSRNAGALDSLALLRLRQQRYEEALRLYERLLEIDDTNAQVHANVGTVLYSLGRSNEALRSLDRALTMDPSLAGTGIAELRDSLRN